MLAYAAAAVRPRGALVWIAACEEGRRNATLVQWLTGAKAYVVLDRFQQGFVLGGHKTAVIARFARHAHVELVSTFPYYEGYLSAYFALALASGEVESVKGNMFTAPELGERTFGPNAVVITGQPTVFTIDNIGDFDF